MEIDWNTLMWIGTIFSFCLLAIFVYLAYNTIGMFKNLITRLPDSANTRDTADINNEIVKTREL